MLFKTHFPSNLGKHDPMNHKHPSYLRSLVSAVLVGIFALVVNHYAKMGPKSLHQSMKSVEKYALKYVNARQEPMSPVAHRTKTLQDIHDAISGEFSKWNRQRHHVDQFKLEAAVQEMNLIGSFLDQQQELSDAERTRYRMTQLVTCFMAAEMHPESQSSNFLELCTQFLETDALANTGRIQLLRFYHQVNFQDPQREQLLYSLRDFSESHSEKKGVTLYGMVAEELAMRRHKDLAVAVLKQGLQIYAGSPGVSRLVNALVEVEQ